MDKFLVEGNSPLSGVLTVSGAKNSALKIMAAALLLREPFCLSNVPNLKDIRTMCQVLEKMGVEIEFNMENGQMKINPASVNSFRAPYELVKTMRASFLVMGPLLARFGKAEVSMPGGCAIGTRPIDLHLQGLKSLGASIKRERGYICMAARELKGANIYFDFPSVGATENTMMAACVAHGETVIENAAREPEIVDLANFLNACGANIKGAGTERIFIQGVSSLQAADYRVMPDRIEAGTFILIACITNSNLEIQNCPLAELEYFLDRLRDCGNDFVVTPTQNLLVKPCDRPLPLQIITRPHPGFPTDLQAQMISYLTMASGTSLVTETIFENRFLHVAELNRMGADVRVEGNRAVIHGPSRLSGAEIMASDIRAGAAVLTAALAAHGHSEISRIYHIDRGYERLEQKLSQVGAKISRVDS